MPFDFFSKGKAAATADSKGKDATKPVENKPVAPVVVPPSPAPTLTLTPSPVIIMMDFDGVIADSRQALFAVSNKLCQDKKLDLKFTKYEDVSKIRSNANLAEKAKLFFNKEEMTNLILNGLAEKIADAKLYEGIKEFVNVMRAANFIIGIVSTNRESTVASFLKLHGLEDAFHFKKCAASTDKTDKLHEVVREYAKKEPIKKESTYYITGCFNHMSVARNIARVIGVTWGGYDSQADLLSARPYSIVHRPDELVALLAKNHPHPLLIEQAPPAPVPPVTVTTEASVKPPEPVVPPAPDVAAATPSMSLR